ncbi:MAG: hypothetical protein HY584_02540 [Candidatus Omnitrophica bacterium]|nr:hypothetical protein [Candidatus Omnitrophota bacterium]
MEIKAILKLLGDSANRGKHLICVAGKVFKARNGREAKRILNRVHKEFPHQKITLAYVPKEDSLVLSPPSLV